MAVSSRTLETPGSGLVIGRRLLTAGLGIRPLTPDPAAVRRKGPRSSETTWWLECTSFRAPGRRRGHCPRVPFFSRDRRSPQPPTPTIPAARPQGEDNPHLHGRPVRQKDSPAFPFRARTEELGSRGALGGRRDLEPEKRRHRGGVQSPAQIRKNL